MTVLVIGASAPAIDQIRAIAPAGVDIVSEPVAQADWIIVATAAERLEVMRARRFEPFRVLEVPELSSQLDASAADALRAALVKMAGIGAPRPLLSLLGVSLVRPFVRRRMTVEAVSAGPAAFDDVATTSATLKSIPSRMPTGQRLDDLLAGRARQRVDRFVAEAVRWPDTRGS